MSAPREYPENVLLDDGSVLAGALRAARDAAVVVKASYDLAVRDHNVEALLVNEKVDSILRERNLDPAAFTIERTTEGELKIVRKDCGVEPPGSLRVAMRQ